MAVAEEKRGICWMLMMVVLLVVPGAVFFAIGALGKCMYGTVSMGSNNAFWQLERIL